MTDEPNIPSPPKGTRNFLQIMKRRPSISGKSNNGCSRSRAYTAVRLVWAHRNGLLEGFIWRHPSIDEAGSATLPPKQRNVQLPAHAPCRGQKEIPSSP